MSEGPSMTAEIVGALQDASHRADRPACLSERKDGSMRYGYSTVEADLAS